jgi:hypothetical protein
MTTAPVAKTLPVLKLHGLIPHERQRLSDKGSCVFVLVRKCSWLNAFACDQGPPRQVAGSRLYKGLTAGGPDFILFGGRRGGVAGGRAVLSGSRLLGKRVEAGWCNVYTV